MASISLSYQSLIVCTTNDTNKQADDKRKAVGNVRSDNAAYMFSLSICFRISKGRACTKKRHLYKPAQYAGLTHSTLAPCAYDGCITSTQAHRSTADRHNDDLHTSSSTKLTGARINTAAIKKGDRPNDTATSPRRPSCTHLRRLRASYAIHSNSRNTGPPSRNIQNTTRGRPERA